jgi:hypothetical protein
MIVSAYNPPTDNLEKSYLSKNYAIGNTVFLVRNSNRFNVNDRILIGEMGNENTEILTVQAVSADGLTVTTSAGSLYPHTASDSVYVLRYDQVKFYRSTTGIDGSYTELVSVAMDVDNESLQTLYEDPTGLSTYYYKISYYNSIASVESSLSDPIPGGGYGRKQVGTLVQEFLTEIGDEQQEYITVPQILSLLNECNEDLTGQSKRPYRFLRKSVLADYSPTPIDLDDIAPDLLRFDRMKFEYTDQANNTVRGNVNMISMEDLEFKQYSSSPIVINPFMTVLDAAIDEEDNTIHFNPLPTTTKIGALKIRYWADFAYITSLADTFQTPVKRIYKLFLLSRYYRMRSKKDTAFLNLSDRYNSDYSTEIVKLQRAQKVDVGTKRSLLPDPRTRSGTKRRAA